MKKTHNERNVCLTTWSEVRDAVYSVNKELAEKIDAANPDSSYKFVKIDYLFGDIPVKRGVIQIPSSTGQLFPITSDEIDKKVKQEIFYRNSPLFLMLTKGQEVFIDTGHRIIPANFFDKGSLCCTYEAMDYMTNIPSDYNWSFASGSRSIFMLPKITDKAGIKRVCTEFNIPRTMLVHELSDHWGLFKSIIQSDQFKQPWKNTILCFGKKWLDENNDSEGWKALRKFLRNQIWAQAHIAIIRVKFGIQWEDYAEAIISRRLKPKPYILDQLKHILSIASGDYPAFIPIDNSQEAIPSKELEKIFIDVYGLKEYMPTLMLPYPLHLLHANQPFYYSLSHATLLEGSPLKKDTSTIMIDQREIKLLFETLNDYLVYRKEQRDAIINQTKIEYFHTEPDKSGEIMPSSKIPETDPYFFKDRKFANNKTFCATSQFFRGCIRITPKCN
ncbi:MAG: hypothetical protein A2103_03145 [Gammaproteobacteria bacterium GWF2_41_13]|nr:MAG: hypothetical protein A2103_03145 [Gammaproteobacteria bacterium GWF2_41_13]